MSQDQPGSQQAEDVFNRSAEHEQQEAQEQPGSIKIQAYGGSRENDGAGGRGERYDDGDGMLGSADMTIMSGKLNITGFGMRTQKKVSTSKRASEVEDRDGRLDTEEDCFDLQAI